MLFLSTRSSLELRSLIFLANTLFSSLIDSSPFDPSALMPFLCTRLENYYLSLLNEYSSVNPSPCSQTVLPQCLQGPGGY